MPDQPCFVSDQEVELYLDRETDPARLRALDQHVRFCHRCSARYEVSSTIKGLVRTACKPLAAPAWLRQNITAELEAPDIGIGAGFWHRMKNAIYARPLIPVGAAALPVIVLLVAIFAISRNTRDSSFVSAMIREHDEYQENLESGLGIKSHDPVEITNWVSANSGMSLSSKSFEGIPEPEGACAIDESGQRITGVFFAQGKSRVSLFMAKDVSQILNGQEARRVKDTTFHMGRQNEKNYICWRCRNGVNILVSEMSADSLFKIAENFL